MPDTRELDYAPGRPKRCRRCYFVLNYLPPQGLCPECGLIYDLGNPSAYTHRPSSGPFVPWLPGLLTAFGSGVVLYVILIPFIGFGWSTTFAIPLAVGTLLGLYVRVGWVFGALLGVVVLCAMMAMLVLLGFTGGLCILVLLALTIGPLLVGMFLGLLLGAILGASTKWALFSDRASLPVIVGTVLLLGAIEGRHRGMAIVSTSTVATINATPEQTWQAIQFYEQVRHRPPLLLWVSPSLRPQYTTGQSEHVGDRKVCVYARGRLVKEITEVVPGKRLAFRVVEQTDIEDDGVRLIDGSFDLSPSADGKGTVVTLTTRYEPKLAPRFAYRPAENLAVHTLHGHVLKGMTEDAESAAGGR